jgi:tRNA pseudouridine55 synthase
VGHIGTLDPFATGVLAIAVNGGTKSIPYITVQSKVYEFEMTFGSKTTTGDVTGEVTDTCHKIPSISELNNILRKFTGEISQTPHAFSAIKIAGQRAYRIARSGQIPNLQPRIVTVFELSLIKQVDSITYKLKTSVSSGTYIRSLSEDIAAALGTFSYVSSLTRIKDGIFLIKDAISLDELNEKADTNDDILIPLENVLDDIPVILLSCQDAKELVMGRVVPKNLNGETGIYLAKTTDGFLEIVEYKDGNIKPKRLLKLN